MWIASTKHTRPAHDVRRSSARIFMAQPSYLAEKEVVLRATPLIVDIGHHPSSPVFSPYAHHQSTPIHRDGPESLQARGRCAMARANVGRHC